MEIIKKFQKDQTETGEFSYLNKNCWLVRNLNYAPYKRCKYCEQKFRRCLFLQYQIVSLLLMFLTFSAFLLIEKKISSLLIITVFTFIIIYGYFFNRSTESIIKANFSQKKAKDALEELTNKLEERVSEQTKAINEKNKYLQELLNMKTDFLRVVNHQLNTPISVVKGALSLMKEKFWDEKKAMDAIEYSFQRISQTVSDFWDAYQLEGEKMQMSPEKVDLISIVKKLINEKKKSPLVVQKKLKLTVKDAVFDIPYVWCDERKITHVISNLLDNAAYYTDKGGISINYEIDDAYLKINIKDTGVGISDDDKGNLFQKFSRGKSASSYHPDGSGMGLYIAKKIVEGNDGEMTYASEGIGKGSTFSFTLPIFKNQQPVIKSDGPLLEKQKIVYFDKNLK